MKYLRYVQGKWQELMKRDCHTVFCYAILITGGIYLAASIVSLGYFFDKVFFLHTRDAFMDFFNSIRDASLGLGAYTERKVIYPPMANLIFMLLSMITPDAYNATGWYGRLSWSRYDENVLLICSFVAVCTILLGVLMYNGFDSTKKKRLLFTAAAVFSVPFLNMLERGNIMTLAFLALLCYAFTYESENRFVRELGIIALAFSVSLKLYPALFAWVLIADKRYGDFVRCVIYSVALLILPSFAFGGPSCLLLIVENIFNFSTGSSGVLSVISRYAHIPMALVSIGAYSLFLLCALCYAASAFLYREEQDKWKIWTLGCITFLSFPALCSTYAWALFLIPLVHIFKRGFIGNDIKGYFVPMTLPFLFLPIPLPRYLTANAIILYVCVFAIAVYAIYDTFTEIKKRKREMAFV